MTPTKPLVATASAPPSRPLLVSFSGVDGAGKSTQIAALEKRLREAGLRVCLLAFWDDVATCAWAREFFSYALFNGERGIGAPGKPVRRRDKNVRSWYMSLARFGLYLLDALRLSAVAAKMCARNDADVIIFDRYLYDELANLDLRNPFTRTYVWLLLKFAPRAAIAFVLDADPAEAARRKPEYGVDFVSSNRSSYLDLSRFAGGITVIPPLAADDVTRILLQEISQRLSGNFLASHDLLTST
jgi:thymidylate kinase